MRTTITTGTTGDKRSEQEVHKPGQAGRVAASVEVYHEIQSVCVKGVGGERVGGGGGLTRM